MFNQTRQSLQAYYNQHEFEHLAADILNSLGYQNVEPIAPLGGPDGGQDIKFTNGEENGVAFVTLRKDIKSKFSEDLAKQIEGDGSKCIFNVYEAVVVWDGVLLTIPETSYVIRLPAIARSFTASTDD